MRNGALQEAHFACDPHSFICLLETYPLVCGNGAMNHHARWRTHAEGCEEGVIVGISSGGIGDWLWYIVDEEGGEAGCIVAVLR